MKENTTVTRRNTATNKHFKERWEMCGKRWF